jgi:hypothetical protein
MQFLIEISGQEFMWPLDPYANPSGQKTNATAKQLPLFPRMAVSQCLTVSRLSSYASLCGVGL